MSYISFREIRPTKTNLINLKEKLSFSEKGKRFLEFKREQLINEIKKLWQQYKTDFKRFINSYKLSFVKLNESYKEMGKRDFILISNMSKIQYTPSININYMKKVGAIIPQINYNLDKDNKLPAYSFNSSSHYLDELMEVLEHFFQNMMQFAESQDFLFKISNSFRKVDRRINGLENNIIPSLKQDIKKIKEKLEEIERENFIRLKKTKDIIEKRKIN